MSFKTHSYYLPFFLCFITFWQFVHLSPCVSKECFHCGIRTPTRTSKQLSTFKLMAAACIWQTKAFATFAANILFLCMYWLPILKPHIHPPQVPLNYFLSNRSNTWRKKKFYPVSYESPIVSMTPQNFPKWLLSGRSSELITRQVETDEYKLL